MEAIFSSSFFQVKDTVWAKVLPKPNFLSFSLDCCKSSPFKSQKNIHCRLRSRSLASSSRQSLFMPLQNFDPNNIKTFLGQEINEINELNGVWFETFTGEWSLRSQAWVRKGTNYNLLPLASKKVDRRHLYFLLINLVNKTNLAFLNRPPLTSSQGRQTALVIK